MGHNQSAQGIVMALAAAMLWGSTGTAQSLAPPALSPLWVGALRMGIAAVFFILLLAWAGAPARASWVRLSWSRALLASLCMAVYNLSFFAGVKALGVGVGTAIAIGSSPIWAGLMQALVLRRWPSPIWWLGTLVGVVGGVLLALAGAQRMPLDVQGLALCLLAGGTYAAYALLNQRLVHQADPALVNLVVFAAAGLLAMALAYTVAGSWNAAASAWGVLLYLGLVATGLAYLLFSQALRRISGATGVTLALAEPVTAFVLAIVVVGEQPVLLAYLGLVCVLVGLALVVWVELRAGRRH